MADSNDCVGNIISPLGIFKRLPTTNSTAALQPPWSAPAPYTPLSSSTATTCTVSTTTATSPTTTVSKKTMDTTRWWMNMWDHEFANKSRAELISDFKKFSPNFEKPNYSQTKCQSSSDDSSTSLPTDHAPKISLEICGIVNDVKTDDYHKEGIDHQNNIVLTPELVSWSDISHGSIGTVSFDDGNDGDNHDPLYDEQHNTAPARSLTSDWASLFLQLKSQSSQQLQDMRVTINEKDKLLAKQRKEIKKLEHRVADLVHEDNMDHLARQQAIAIYSSHSDSSSDAASVSSQQSQGKTPTITGSVSITGSVFDSTLPDSEPDTLEVTKSPEVSLPSPAQSNRRKDESCQITRMLDSVDKLAKHYSPKHRYHQPNVTNLSQPRSDVVPDSLFNYELAALWMFSKDPAEEEIAQYDRRLEQELRPAPIHSPPLRRPYVNWTNLNKHRRKNLPDPQLFPVSSVPADPSFYTDTARYKPADRHTIHSYCGPVPLRMTKEECGCVVCVSPFGQKYGLMTDVGIIGMPQEPVHGYCWDDDMGGWVIATGCC